MWRRVLVTGAVPAVLLLAGCTATGMGWIPSNDGVDKATFGFTFDDTTSTLSGSYHDPQGMTAAHGVVDVAFKGTGVIQPCKVSDAACGHAPANIKGACAEGDPSYESQNPKLPGSGTLHLQVCDVDGNGAANPGDFISITVSTGPYTGYHNQGDPQGNITVRP